jgi:anti-repressor protein
MNNLSILTNQSTIKSTEIVDIINDFRKAEGNENILQHYDFMKKIRKEIETLENLDLGGRGNFSESSYNNSQNKKQPCFELNRDGMLQMLNSESTYVRYKTIEYINKLEEKLKIPTTYKEALLQLVQAEEEKELLELENKQKGQIIEEQKPKVIFADAVSASHTSILVGELAKILKQNGVDMGQNKFFQWLRNNGYLIKRKGTDYNMPTQRSMEQGLFEIKETSVSHSDGHISVNKTSKVTGKGQQYFINKFLQGQAVQEVACAN